MKAYQPRDTTGTKMPSLVSFKLPEDLAEAGEATLALAKEWNGTSHHWTCRKHNLVITRLNDNK